MTTNQFLGIAAIAYGVWAIFLLVRPPAKLIEMDLAKLSLGMSAINQAIGDAIRKTDYVVRDAEKLMAEAERRPTPPLTPATKLAPPRREYFGRWT